MNPALISIVGFSGLAMAAALGMGVRSAFGSGRIVLALLCVPVIAFCGFGFLACFEPPGHPILQAVYALVAGGCLQVMGLLLFGKPDSAS